MSPIPPDSPPKDANTSNDSQGIVSGLRAITSTQYLTRRSSNTHIQGQDQLAPGADDKEKDTLGQTPLHLAAAAGLDGTVFSLLQQKRWDINARNSLGQTALILAAKHGHDRVVYRLLREGANANIKDNENIGALSRAIMRQRLDVITTLLQHPTTDVNLHELARPVYWAVASPNIRVYRAFMENARGLKFNVIDTNRNSLLHYACKVCHFSEIVDDLSRVVNVNCINADGDSPLHTACEFNHIPGVLGLVAGRRGILQVNLKNRYGETPLHKAVKSSSKECVARLLQHPDIDVHATDDKGCTTLFLACQNDCEGNQDNIDILLSLIQFGGDVNRPSLEGLSPLMAAVRDDSFVTAHYLLECPDIDIHATDPWRRTVLLYACEPSRWSIAWRLIQMGADVNWADDEGKTPLYEGCVCNHQKLVKQVLASPNCQVNRRTGMGSTALFVAAMHGHEELVHLLLAHNADPDLAVPATRSTPLHAAIAHGHVRIAKRLAQRVTDLDARDSANLTTLCQAKAYGYNEVVYILARRGGREGSVR